MKLTALSKEETTKVENNRGIPSPLHDMLTEFVKMGVRGVEIENHTYSSVASGVGSIRGAIKRFNMNSIECINVGDKIYLINNSVK